jgi:hypothetical protein
LNTDIKIQRIVPVTDYVKTKIVDLGNHIMKNTFTIVTWKGMIITNTLPNNHRIT